MTENCPEMKEVEGRSDLLDKVMSKLIASPASIEAFTYRFDGDLGGKIGGLCIIPADRYLMLRDLIHRLLLDGELISLAQNADWNFTRMVGSSPQYKRLLREYLESIGCDIEYDAKDLLSPIEWPNSLDEGESSGEMVLQ